MCYGTCKYEYSFGNHEMTGECSIYHLLGTDQMPEDAECVRQAYERGDSEHDIQNTKSR